MEPPESHMTSTIDPSLRFFEDFFLKGGFHNLHENFFITQFRDSEGNWQTVGTNNVSREEEWRELVERRRIQLSASSDDYVEEDYFYKEYFTDLLQKLLSAGVKNSKKSITKKIASFDFYHEKIVTYLKVVLNDLAYIISEVKDKKEYSKYRHNAETLYRFVVHLFKRYNAFLSPTEFSIYNEAKEFLRINILEKASEKKEVYSSDPSKKATRNKNSIEIKGFKWIANPEENTYHLYNFFIDNSVISKTGTAEKFKTAFKGEIIVTPLKIEWLFKAKGGHIKPAILRVINLLMYELEVLEDMPIQLQRSKTIEAIFCKSGGKPIINTEESISQGKKIKGVIKDMVLDELIDKLRKVPFSATISEYQ